MITVVVGGGAIIFGGGFMYAAPGAAGYGYCIGGIIPAGGGCIPPCMGGGYIPGAIPPGCPAAIPGI